MDRETLTWRQTITGGLAILLLMLACVAVMGLTINTLCANALNEKLPIYPGAVELWEEHNMFSRFGLGSTYVMLESPDDPDVVQDWYNRHTADVLRNRRDERLLYFGQGQWSVSAQEDGTGSQIVLHGTCAQ